MDDSWVLNLPSCPVQLSIKTTIHAVEAANTSGGNVLKYELACFKREVQRYKLIKRGDTVGEEIASGHFLTLNDSHYSIVRKMCESNGSKVGISQTWFSDGAVWFFRENASGEEGDRLE